MDDSRGVYNHEIVLPTKKHPIMLYFHADGLGYVAHHWHRSLEICDYINTPCRLWYGGRVMDLMPDTPIIINSGDIHSLTPQNHSDPRGVSLIFPYEFMSQYGIDIDRIRFAYTSNPAVDQRLRQSLHRLADLGERRGTDPYCHLLCNAEIFNVLHLLMTYYQDSHNTPLSNRHVERSRELLAYMNRHYQENITLQSAAEHLNLSVGYLCRFFRKYLGTTFKDHLTDLRLQRAQAAISATDQTLLDIALDCGFPDYRTFVSTFRRKFQMTPRQYKQCPVRFVPDITQDYASGEDTGAV